MSSEDSQDSASERSDPAFRRVLLKLSGQILGGDLGIGLNPTRIDSIASELAQVRRDFDIQLGLVVGGGNIIRGARSESGFSDRVAADHMGVLATAINSLALKDHLEQNGVSCALMTAIEIPGVAEPFMRDRAIRYLEEGRVILFARGTGNPFLTTDAVAALRAAEIGADVFLKATKMDGIFTRDSGTDPSAEKIEVLSFDEMLSRNPGVMDAAAAALCKENNVKLIVFDFRERGNLDRILRGDSIGSTVKT